MTAQPLATHTDLTGRVLLGRYRIVRELAKGGMGVVYLARVEGAVGFVKPVVVKLLLPEHTEDDRIVSMFVREARILAQLRHPSLVDVLEFGEQDGGYVLVLEYVRGYHLGLWLRYLSEKKRSASADVLIQIVIDVLDALHHAHTQRHPDGSHMQIVHRDVSPSNILLDEAGRGRLLDFGVARMRGGGHEYKTQVQGGFMGKLPYTAPEIFAGGEASPRSDLYACAVVLHEAIFGRNVFRGETQASTLQRVLNHRPEPLEALNPTVPKGLDAVLARALAKSPHNRHEDARELAMELRRLLSEPESEIRARLADVLKDDFGPEMAKLFNLESLEERDAAWRKLSFSNRPEPAPLQVPLPAAPANDQLLLPANRPPAPAGATIVSRNRRAIAQGEPRRETGGIAIPTAAASVAPAGTQPSLPTIPPPTRARTGANSVLPVEEQEVVLEDDDDAEVETVPAPSGPTTTPKGWKPAWLAAGLGLVAMLAAAGFWLHAWSGTQPPAPHGVAGRPTVFHPPQPVPAPTPIAATPEQPAQPDPLPSAATPPPTAASETAAQDKTKKPKPAAPDASALTRALRKQRPKLEACFLNHSVALEGQARTQLIFDLAADGTQTNVELSPKLLTQTELGQCLLSVARSTRFPPQARAVSFTIPLTASTSRD